MIEKEVKNYNLTKEDICMPSITVSRENSFRVKLSKFIFENKINILSLLKPTETIFNTGVETSEINEKDFIDQQIEMVKNILKETTENIFLTSRFFV